MNRKNTHSPYSRGFTILEATIAISILAAGIVAPLTLAHSNIKASQQARERIIATNLAQEGIEMVRNMIMNNNDNDPTGGTWLNQIVAGGGSCESNACIADIAEGDPAQIFKNCPVGNCTDRSRMYVHPTTNVYRQTSPALSAPWTVTEFRREIRVQETVSGKEATISVTVWWNKGSVTLETIIQNWFFNLS